MGVGEASCKTLPWAQQTLELPLQYSHLSLRRYVATVSSSAVHDFHEIKALAKSRMEGRMSQREKETNIFSYSC